MISRFIHSRLIHVYIDMECGKYASREPIIIRIFSATVIFNILLLGCAILGVFASTLVLVALKCVRQTA